MKLYAVVDRDGDIIRTFTSRDDACEYAVINVDFIKELTAYDPTTHYIVERSDETAIGNRSALSGIIKHKELHTYDPASQVVVDRDVYENILYAFSKTKRYVIQGDYDKFLSAGKEAT